MYTMSRVRAGRPRPERGGESFPAGSQQTVTLEVSNHGAGMARNVTVSGTLPDNLRLVGIGDPSACTVQGSTFRCTLPELGVAQSRTVSVTVGAAAEGSYTLSAGVSSEDLDANAADNASSATVSPPRRPWSRRPGRAPTRSGGRRGRRLHDGTRAVTVRSGAAVAGRSGTRRPGAAARGRPAH